MTPAWGVGDGVHFLMFTGNAAWEKPNCSARAVQRRPKRWLRSDPGPGSGAPSRAVD